MSRETKRWNIGEDVQYNSWLEVASRDENRKVECLKAERSIKEVRILTDIFFLATVACFLAGDFVFRKRSGDPAVPGRCDLLCSGGKILQSAEERIPVRPGCPAGRTGCERDHGPHKRGGRCPPEPENRAVQPEAIPVQGDDALAVPYLKKSIITV